MALTELVIRNLKPKKKVYRVTDSHGLTLEITPTGTKLWRWRYRYQGKAMMLALGKYPAVSLADARKKRNAASDLLDAGKNPTREKQLEKLRAVREGENTFSHLAKLWMDNREQGEFNEKYLKQNSALFERYVFPKIGKLPITEITIPDVVHIIDAIVALRLVETGKRVKQQISQVFRYAAQRGLCQQNPAADLRDILPSVKGKHHASVALNELPTLLRTIEAREDDLTKAAMKLLAFTFVRTGELIGAKWQEIDFKNAEWNIPAERMKMKRPHVVPLSTQSLAVLEQLKKRTGNKVHVFHSTSSKSLHISNGTILMGLRRMGYKNKMTGHGFRSIASTILNEQGYAPDVIEKQLAHDDNDKIRAAYNRAEYLGERKKMMQEYADYLEWLLSPFPKNAL